MDTSVEISGLITAVAAAWALPWKISSNMRRDRETEAARVLTAAKEADAQLRKELHARIELMENKFESLKHEIDKDLEHIKETYNGALANLGEKIEDLRKELRNQHGQLVSLISEFIKKQ
jgi:uncharacterized protein YPO0396